MAGGRAVGQSAPKMKMRAWWSVNLAVRKTNGRWSMCVYGRDEGGINRFVECPRSGRRLVSRARMFLHQLTVIRTLNDQRARGHRLLTALTFSLSMLVEEN